MREGYEVRSRRDWRSELCRASWCARALLFFDDEQRLAEFDRAAILDEYADDPACELRLDLVHHLHGFDDAERVAGLHFAADLDEGLRTGRRAAIERADHGGRDLLPARRGRRRWCRALGGRGRG